MAGREWPGAVQRVREQFPVEARILRGFLGFFSGAFLLASTSRLLFASNWYLGFRSSVVLASVFLLALPAGLGLVSPVWYWLGRPLWVRLGRPAIEQVRPHGAVWFLPGLLGAVLGSFIALQVEATSGYWVQTLAPFGLAVAIGCPLWLWLVGPFAGHELEARLPATLSEKSGRVRRATVALLVLLVASALVTSSIGLPMVGLGETVSDDGLEVSIDDARVVEDVTEAGGDGETADGQSGVLVVEVAVENTGSERRAVPGASVLEILTIAPTCEARTFGEPSNNCDEVYMNGNFSAAGTTYPNYDDRQAAIDGALDPGERLSGWLAFRLEGTDERAAGRPVVIVDDVGRWRLGEVNATGRAQP